MMEFAISSSLPMEEALKEWRPNETVDPMLLMYEMSEFSSAEGFCYGYVDLDDVSAEDVLDRDAHAAETILDRARKAASELDVSTRCRLVQEDFVTARDVGLGGHCSARDYQQQLLDYPPDPSQWGDECFPAAGKILSQARHLFFLAQAARWERPQKQDDLNYYNRYRYLQLYFAARTLVSGPVRDAAGHDVHHPLMNALEPSAFEELGWPRYSEQMTDEGEVLVIKHDESLDIGSFWDSKQTRYHCNHFFEFFWSGLLCPSYLERIETQKNRVEESSSNEEEEK